MRASGSHLLLACLAAWYGGSSGSSAVGASAQRQQLPPLELSIVGPGASVADPAFGEVVTLAVGGCGDSSTRPVGAATGGSRSGSIGSSGGSSSGSGSTCPPWVRVERADVGALHGPAHASPVFQPTAVGNFAWKFGGKSDNAPVPIVASGWSSKYNGTRLTANSSVILAHYVVTRQQWPTRLEVQPRGPGSARITVVAANSSEPLTFNRA